MPSASLLGGCDGLFGNRGRAIRSGNVGGLIKLLYLK